MIHRSDGRVYVRRIALEEFSDRCVQKIVKHGGGGIMVWECITANGVGLLWQVEGRLIVDGYTQVLENALIPTLHYHRIPELSNWIFQQDNAPCHTARLTKNWFAEKAIEVMEWPAQSPDINPIENLWDQIATRVSERKKQ